MKLEDSSREQRVAVQKIMRAAWVKASQYAPGPMESAWSLAIDALPDLGEDFYRVNRLFQEVAERLLTTQVIPNIE